MAESLPASEIPRGTGPVLTSGSPGKDGLAIQAALEKRGSSAASGRAGAVKGDSGRTP
jgi:hypothetical protein